MWTVNTLLNGTFLILQVHVLMTVPEVNICNTTSIHCVSYIVFSKAGRAYVVYVGLFDKPFLDALALGSQYR